MSWEVDENGRLRWAGKHRVWRNPPPKRPYLQELVLAELRRAYPAKLTNSELAQRTGRSRSNVANALRRIGGRAVEWSSGAWRARKPW